ncbi:MAG: DNA alkylation repair protein, partial [Candidatus Heimdallarchaeota archaeon]
MKINDISIDNILKYFQENANQKSLEGMARVGITPEEAYGVKIPVLRALAKSIGKNTQLAQELWEINKRETRILACMIADPNEVTEELLEAWVKDFDYWEICDQCILNLFEKSRFAYLKSFEWAKRKEEYVKRAGFVLMARLAFGDRKATDDSILEFLPAIKENINDDRNTVKKAISWALREMGKRSIHMN